MSVAVSFVGGLLIGYGTIGFLLGMGPVVGVLGIVGAALLCINFLVLLPREIKKKEAS